ncbi:DODA-type extradiol aromatic ring-opening family dioxygenase [Vibrio nitrifigilis]|uniref:Dioxygenase n=1 Tax=Vibrio nitrifigilis TaxID=2789781 RepID=A0ABS0GKC3_9VIBR|nr:class III extradiol ring-cleavage dioxygenase [Vibrio nitrifigilis]MBF9002926.1 dioxygenase [Vibrio nitrifigilis]
MSKSRQILYLSHGGGPIPLLGDEGHQEMVDHLTAIAKSIPKPDAIIVVSAHWEESVPTITAAPNPGMIYDYYGFPEQTYHITYPAPGEPQLAEKVYNHLQLSGINAKLDVNRGYDHGLFVPLMLMYPDADIPCIQLSLANNLDPVHHLDIGAALSELDYDNLLVIGSGFSFHNMRAFFAPQSDEIRALNEGFEAWLVETCSDTSLSEAERTERFAQWTKAPGARFCQPREEHLLPLHVCYGVAQRACDKYYQLNILGKRASMYYWKD